jgi:hypothetical protein
MATERQKKILVNLGKGKSMKQAMLEAGYSKAYAKNPHQLKQTESFQEIFNRYIPDSLISKATRQLVKDREPFTYTFPASFTEEEVHDAMKKKGIRKNQYFCKLAKDTKVVRDKIVEVEYWRVDGSKPSGLVIPKGLDIAMRGKGYYAPEKIALTDTEGKDLKDDDLDKTIEELEKQLRVNFLKEAKNGNKQVKSSGSTKPTD